jgi:hypothetical protein
MPNGEKRAPPDSSGWCVLIKMTLGLFIRYCKLAYLANPGTQ